MEASFGLMVVAGVVWILLMIFALLKGMFKDTVVVGIIGGSLVLAIIASVISVFAIGGTWNQSEFIYYLVFWWVSGSVLLGIFPIVVWVRCQFS